MPLIYRTFNAVLEPRIGRILPDAEIRSHFGPPDQTILGRYVGEVEQAAAFAEYIERYRRDHHEHVYVYDGIHDLLLELNREHGITIITVTHNERLAAVADRRLRLSGGRLQIDLDEAAGAGRAESA